MFCLKKGDVIIIISCFLLSIVSALVVLRGNKNGKSVVIKQNNTEIYTGSLFEDKIITAKSNTIEIKNGRVSVINADCENQICVNHRSVSRKGEAIVCLPNKLSVEIK